MLNCKSPRLRGLIGIGRADDRKLWNCAQVDELLDWLVSGAILPESDAVVRKHVDRFEMTQGPQADGRLHVVGKTHRRVRPFHSRRLPSRAREHRKQCSARHSSTPRRLRPAFPAPTLHAIGNLPDPSGPSWWTGSGPLIRPSGWGCV